MKPVLSGSGTKKKKKQYYFAETMQFTVSYIKALNTVTGYVPNRPE